MLTIELSADIFDDYCQISLLGTSHSKTMIDQLSHIRTVDNYLALVVYDYLLTSGSEASFFWKPHRFNGATILFLLNRYLTLIVQILMWVPSPTSFQVNCLASL